MIIIVTHWKRERKPPTAVLIAGFRRGISFEDGEVPTALQRVVGQRESTEIASESVQIKVDAATSIERPTLQKPAIANFGNRVKIIGGEVLLNTVGRKRVRPMSVAVVRRNGQQMVVHTANQLHFVGDGKGREVSVLSQRLRTADGRRSSIPQGIHVQIVLQIVITSIQLQ